MAFYAPSKGNVFIDRGAADALVNRGKSLLCAGVCAVEGDFSKGDVVRILTSGDHKQIGRGITQLSKSEFSSAINNRDCTCGIAVRKDDLVLTKLS